MTYIQDKNIFCAYKNCHTLGTESNPVQLHHIIPRAIGGTDKMGRVYLCKKHHDITHGKIVRIVWAFVPQEKKEAARRVIKKYIFEQTHK